MKATSREYTLGKTLLNVRDVEHRYADQVVLRDAGLAWRKGINSTPEFVEVERRIRERFRTL